MNLLRFLGVCLCLSNSDLVFGQGGPGGGVGGGGPVALDCVKLVQKSCEDVYGTWPGPRPPIANCWAIECVDENYCVIGESHAIFWNTNQPSWVAKLDIHVGVPSGETGRFMSDKRTELNCKYIEVCEYECDVDPMNGNKRCKMMHRVYDALYKYQVDHGSCDGPIN